MDYKLHVSCTHAGTPLRLRAGWEDDSNRSCAEQPKVVNCKRSAHRSHNEKHWKDFFTDSLGLKKKSIRICRLRLRSVGAQYTSNKKKKTKKKKNSLSVV